MSPRPRKLTAYGDLQLAIIETAKQCVDDAGVNAVSLRAIARQLGIKAPSIYHYYPDRDALLRALQCDALCVFASALGESQRSMDTTIGADRLLTLGLAYRSWAVAHPGQYQLACGGTVAESPADDPSVEAATLKLMAPWISLLSDLFHAGRIRGGPPVPLSPSLAAMLRAWQRAEGGANLEILYLALAIWCRLHGMVSLELGRRLPACFDHPEELYRRELANLVAQVCL